MLQSGLWEERVSGTTKQIVDSLNTTVAANGVQVWVLNEQVSNLQLLDKLRHAMAYK